MKPPHGRGKGFLAMMVMVPSLGLPPRRRGKCVQADSAGAWAGITPAWAGKRRELSSCRTNRRDHPRMGGEKTESSSVSMNPRGSPPRGRGKGWRVVDHHPLPGITPAQAGKSSAKFPHRTSARDHPRTGGEKHNVFTLGSLVQGSPPRRRGKATLDGHVAQGHGITPAWAGKSVPA